MNKHFIYLIFFVLLSSCGVISYSFKGETLKYETVKKILITQYNNSSGTGPSNISVIFTERTKDYYIQNGKFELVGLNEDLRLECDITSYRVAAEGATAAEIAQRYKLSITVKYNFYDYLDEKNNASNAITRFDFYESNQNLSDVESNLIQNISEQIIMDIFINTVTKKW